MVRSHHLALAAAALLGCGGGSPPEPPPDVGVAIEPDHLAVAWNLEDTPGYPERLMLTAAEPVQLELEWNPDFSLQAVDVLQGGAGYVAGLAFMPAQPSARGPGVHEGELRLHVRAQRKGKWLEVAGSPLAIPYAYTVRKPVLSVSPAELDLSAVAGQSLERTLSLDGRDGEGPWSITVSGVSASVEPASGTALPATVKVVFDTTTAVNAYGNLIVRRGSKEVRVYASVGISVAPITYAGPPIELAVLSGGPGHPPPITVDLGTSTGASTYFLASAVLDPATEAVPLGPDLNGTAPGRFSFQLLDGVPPPGEYTGKLWLDPQLGSPSTAIPFAIHVSAGSLSFPLAPLEFHAGPSWPASDSVRTIEVTSTSPGVSFTAETDGSWLSVSPASGVPAPKITLTARMDPAALPPDSGLTMGQVTLSWSEPDGTPVTRRITASCRFSFPKAGRVEPPAVASGPVTVEAPVAFPAVPWEPPPTIMFGDTPGTVAVPVRSGLVRVTPPSLAPGTYPVWIWNAVGVRRESGATLTVLAAAPRAAASWPSPGPASRIFLDERTGSLLSVHPSAGKVVRHRERDGWAEDVLDVPGLDDAVLRGGGDRLVAMTSAGVFLVDPASLATTQPYAWTPGNPSAGWSWTLAPSADGVTLAFAADSGCTSPCSPVLLLPGVLPGTFLLGDVPFAYPGAGASSGDLGSSVGVRHQPTNPLPIWTYDPDANPASASTSGTSLSLDRTGSRILVLDQVAGGTASKLFGAAFAEVPGVLPTTTAAAVLSPDGARAYTFDAATRKVRTFDLVGPPEAGAFVETGAAETPVADPGDGVAIALTADARTVLLAGDAHVVLVPLP